MLVSMYKTACLQWCTGGAAGIGAGDRREGLALRPRLRGRAPVGRSVGAAVLEGGRGEKREERRSGVVHACADLVGLAWG